MGTSSSSVVVTLRSYYFNVNNFIYLPVDIFGHFLIIQIFI
ncbi:hypothetical protein THF1C08_90160 [Vibrio jasicida]|uniref:Uncharacterized protein n=1 Tax=Vibrio jasicida TaxID=766224 RepID=A0AAU9QXE7_9VIBR|nr:hypothetical protein THF1C08_90160 [Vibrio jasicida]CAH1603776.1 hypothetical protein THF1A12_80154 [Vibrio jasicida]